MNTLDRYNRGEKRGSSVEDEVQKLLRRNGKITNADFLRLRICFLLSNL